MTWLHRYRCREFLRSSIWVAPTLGLVCAIVCARFLRGLDAEYHFVIFDFTSEGARGILGAFIASMLTFVVVVVSSLLLAVQLASAQLTPRIIAPTFRHPLVRVALTTFVFAYALSIAVAGRLDERVPQLAVSAAIFCNIFSVILFLYFVGAVGLALRPAYILSTMAAQGRKVIMDVYPTPFDPLAIDDEACAALTDLGTSTALIEHAGSSGVLLAFDRAGLVALACHYQAVIEIVPRVGEFVASGEPLFKIYSTSQTIDKARLRAAVALGAERTLEQDPEFAFRITVDIACKALSPAINDPTTAALAIDQLYRLLRGVGTRMLYSGKLTDANGALRVVFPTPSWADFVSLAIVEIRHYGADSVQVCGKLRHILENLIQLMPESRKPALQEQLELVPAIRR